MGLSGETEFFLTDGATVISDSAPPALLPPFTCGGSHSKTGAAPGTTVACVRKGVNYLLCRDGVQRDAMRSIHPCGGEEEVVAGAVAFMGVSWG
jgi:hypothetical protein